MDAVLDRIAAELKKRGVRIQDSFADFDKLRCGNVTRDQFRRCLAKANVLVLLSEPEQQSLLQHFEADDSAHVSYVRFLNEVQPREHTAATVTAAEIRNPLSEKEEAALRHAEEHFVHSIVSTGMDVRLCFRDFDRMNNGRISANQFERAFPFHCDSSILGHLKKKYVDVQGMICYAAWCSDIAALVKKAKDHANGGEQKKCLEQSPRKEERIDPESIIEELRQQLATNRIRIEDHFKDYDKNRSGTLPAGQFDAALGRVKLVRYVITPQRLAALHEKYLTNDGASGEAKMRYRQFLEDIDPTQHEVSPTKRMRTLSPQDHQKVEPVLARIRTIVHTRRLALKATFQDFDRASKGIYQTRTCTRHRFERALAINKIMLTAPEMEVLCAKYEVPVESTDSQQQHSGEINYVAFCSDVEIESVAPETVDLTANAPPANAETEQPPQANTPPVSLSTLMDRVMQHLLLRRVRLSDFFRDFDPLRSGIVSDEKFAAALAVAGFKLTEAELAALTCAFACPEHGPHSVKYSNFLKEVDTDIVVEDPSSPSRDRTAELKERLAATHPKRTLPSEDKVLLDAVLSRISETVRGRGMLLPPFFADYDKRHSGRITATQFGQVISRHKLPISPSELTLIIAAFGDPMDSSIVQWKQFVAAVDETENVELQRTRRLEARKAAGSPTGADSKAQTSSVEEILSRIKAHLIRTKARLTEFFHDNDPLRRGFVPRAKFAAALDMLKIHLTKEEHDALYERFSSQRNCDSVEYIDFVRLVEETAPGATTADWWFNGPGTVASHLPAADFGQHEALSHEAALPGLRQTAQRQDYGSAVPLRS